MTCPTCGQSASNFHRFVFTIQGVTIRQSIRGFLRCQSCSAFLRLVGYSRFIWLQIVLAATFVALYTCFARQLISFMGLSLAQAALVPLLLVVGYASTYLFWRGARIEKVEEGGASA
jgi:hypothetical protein